MNRLYSIAVPLLIASSGAIPTIPTIPLLGPPGPLTSGIVALDDGTVYFVDSFSDVVWRMQPGSPLHAFVSGRNGRVLCADADGHLYGTHKDESGRITTWRADESGAVVDLTYPEVPQYGHPFVVEDNGDIIAPRGSGKSTGVRLVRASDHDHEVLAGGDMGFRDGTGRKAQFFPIGGMTRTPEGDLLVTSGSSVRRVSPDGAVRTIATDQRLLEPRHSFLARLFGAVHGHLTGIALGERGDIFVANSSRDAIIHVGSDGRAREFLKSDDGWTPTGVATAHGSLYVLEYGHGVRVVRLDADGTLTVVAHVKPERPVAAARSLGRFLIPAAMS